MSGSSCSVQWSDQQLLRDSSLLLEALLTKNEVAANILVEQPDFDVNMRSTASLQTTYNGKAVESGMIFYSALDIAVATGYAVEKILSLPGIAVNVKGWGV